MGVEKHFTSSILLWMRTDQPRQTGMDHWKGPHSGIISASPGLEEYRQIHLAEVNPGLWPAYEGIETNIPDNRRADGVAEVTIQSALAPALPRLGRPRVRRPFCPRSVLPGPAIQHLSQMLAPVASSIHASYDVSAALTFVKDGRILPHYEE